MPLILKAHGDAILGKRPQILRQAVIELALPFARQEATDRLATSKEFAPVSPLRIFAVRLRDAFGVARIPAIFRQADFLRGGLDVERRQWWAGRFHKCLGNGVTLHWPHQNENGNFPKMS